MRVDQQRARGGAAAVEHRDQRRMTAIDIELPPRAGGVGHRDLEVVQAKARSARDRRRYGAPAPASSRATGCALHATASRREQHLHRELS